MEQRVIEIKKREQIGTPASRLLRRQGHLPSVVYARGEKSVPVLLSYKDFVHVAGVSKISQVFTLKSSEIKELDGRLAVIKEVQRDFLKDRLLHIDLQALHDNEEINVKIPIRVVGEAPGVKNQGGILTVVSRELGVQCLPKLIPTELAVDVSMLSLGQSIHAKAVPLPEGVKLHGNPDETVVSVVTVRITAEEEAAATAATAATAEGAVAGAAAGATPAAGAAAPAAEGGAKDAAAGAKDAGKKDAGAKKETKK